MYSSMNVSTADTPFRPVCGGAHVEQYAALLTFIDENIALAEARENGPAWVAAQLRRRPCACRLTS